MILSILTPVFLFVFSCLIAAFFAKAVYIKRMLRNGEFQIF